MTEMASIPEFFQVSVWVHCARHLQWAHTNPVVGVSIEGHEKFTVVREDTDCPYYNQNLFFHYHEPVGTFLDKIITISVYHNEDFVPHRKLLASSSLDVSAVWMEPGHQLVGKWAPLLLCDDFTCKVKGYVRVSVTVTGREGAATLAVREQGEDAEIEGNLLLPRGLALECQRALFVLRVYRAAGVPRVKGLLAPSPRIKKRGLDHLPDLMVIVTFSGFKVGVAGCVYSGTPSNGLEYRLRGSAPAFVGIASFNMQETILSAFELPVNGDQMLYEFDATDHLAIVTSLFAVPFSSCHCSPHYITMQT